MTQERQWLIGQLGVLLAFVGFTVQVLIQEGTAVFGPPWSGTGAEGWAFWGFSIAAIGTAIQLAQFLRGELDLSCHRMPGGMSRWVYPALMVIGPLLALASATLLVLEAS
ncbi:MAG: hypothetical protein V5A58_11445 [Salinibacter sp.]|jgi:hypothetical protein|uniref:hypothetical protein n=1 Tax=Salinibacter sp. TaxID=2065818 RepID=UPI002FC389FA